jgi:hypothetical protein
MLFSNFGDPYLENGILVPGENVKGASPTAYVALRSGTSFAAPIMTGVVALLLSCLRQIGQDADPRTVRAALLSSAVPSDPELPPPILAVSPGVLIFRASSRSCSATQTARPPACCHPGQARMPLGPRARSDVEEPTS